jgi:hypothetical protein
MSARTCYPDGPPWGPAQRISAHNGARVLPLAAGFAGRLADGLDAGKLAEAGLKVDAPIFRHPRFRRSE